MFNKMKDNKLKYKHIGQTKYYFSLHKKLFRASLVSQRAKNSPTIWEN